MISKALDQNTEILKRLDALEDAQSSQSKRSEKVDVPNDIKVISVWYYIKTADPLEIIDEPCIHFARNWKKGANFM